MALSVAELRARLAASKSNSPAGVTDGKAQLTNGQQKSGTPSVAPSQEIPAGAAPDAATQQPAASPTAATERSTDGTSIPSGPREGQSQAVPATVQSGTVVVAAEIQSTTLVVVERPSSLEDSGKDGSGGNDDSAGSSTNLDRTNPVHFGFLQRLADLERALLDRDPLMKTHLAAIHKTAIDNEEIVALLTTEEIAKIMAAQQVHTNTVLVKETVKAGKKAAAAKVAKISIDDI